MLKKILSIPGFILKNALRVLAVLLCVASIGGYFGNYGQVFELASHFRLVYALGFLGCGAAFVVLRLWKALTLTMAIFLLTDAIPLLQMYSPSTPANLELASNTVTLFHANLWGGINKNYAATVDLLKTRNPDLICLSEVTPAWGRQLKAALSSEYPHHIVEDRFGGVALFSKYPITSSKLEYFDAGTRIRPRIMAKLKVRDSELTCLVVHTLVPLGKWYKQRNGEFEVIADELNSISGNKILVGDLNCSPWSSYFQGLLSKAQMFDSERGFGPQASWPTLAKVPFIPIDHCLVGPSVQAVARQVGPNIGSDHLPFQVTLALDSTVKKSSISYRKRTI